MNKDIIIVAYQGIIRKPLSAADVEKLKADEKFRYKETRKNGGVKIFKNNPDLKNICLPSAGEWSLDYSDILALRGLSSRYKIDLYTESYMPIIAPDLKITKDAHRYFNAATATIFFDDKHAHPDSFCGIPDTHDFQANQCWTDEDMMRRCKTPGSIWYVDNNMKRLKRAHKAHFKAVLIDPDINNRFKAEEKGIMSFESIASFARAMVR